MARSATASSLLRPAFYVRRAAISRGLMGDDRFWRVVFAVIFGRKLLRKALGSEPETLSVEKLKAGQFVSVEAIDPRTIPPKKRRLRRS